MSSAAVGSAALGSAAAGSAVLGSATAVVMGAAPMDGMWGFGSSHDPTAAISSVPATSARTVAGIAEVPDGVVTASSEGSPEGRHVDTGRA